MNKKKLLFVVNVDWFFVSHRLPIALKAMAGGYEVHLLCAITDQSEYLESLGLIVHPFLFSRSGENIFNELACFFGLYKHIKNIKPDLIHLVTIKPVLYGGIAARMAGLKNVVAAISGLGFIFAAQGIKANIRRFIVSIAYKLALHHKNIRVIFQNPTDRITLTKLVTLSDKQIIMVHGSGVDLSEFNVFNEPEKSAPVVILAARLLYDKGVGEFVEAARLLADEAVNARFCLVGEPDLANPNSISNDELAHWVDEGVVESWGHRNDMPAVLSSANIVVLPSYGEGLPKVLIEAAACGRAVITTDMPGCRDAILPGITGILIPPRNAKELANAIRYLIENVDLRHEMARSGRKLAEQKFSIEYVVDAHLKIYDDLIRSEL